VSHSQPVQERRNARRHRGERAWLGRLRRAARSPPGEPPPDGTPYNGGRHQTRLGFRITAVIPYYGYAKQEKKSRSREPITAKLMADLLQVAGADRSPHCDLHAPANRGLF